MSIEYPYQFKDTALPKREYQKRRQTLMTQMEDDSIAIIPSAGLQTRSNDTEYKFRQDSDFFYLTGFLEPNSVLVLLPVEKTVKLFIFALTRIPSANFGMAFDRVQPEFAKTSGLMTRFPSMILMTSFLA